MLLQWIYTVSRSDVQTSTVADARGHAFAELKALWENGEDMRFYCVPCFMEWYSVTSEREMQRRLGIGSEYERYSQNRDAERVQRFQRRR